MNPEPLIGKKVELLDKLLVQVNDLTVSQKETMFNKGYNLGFEAAIDCAFERFKSAVDFYKKELYQEIKKKYPSSYRTFWLSEHKELCELVDRCFGDVIDV